MTLQVGPKMTLEVGPTMTLQVCGPSETLQGSSTIRAFNKKEQFIDAFNKILNNNIIAAQW